MPDPTPAPPGRLRDRVAWNLAAQGFWSGSNFLLTFLVLVRASPRAFALFSVCITTYLLAAQLNRWLIGIPILLAAEGSAEGAAGASVVLGLAGVPVLVAVAAAWHEAAPVFLVLAATLPFALVQDGLRHVAIARHQAKAAALTDAVCLGVLLAASVAAVAAGSRSPAVYLAAWGGASAVAAALLAGMIGVRPRASGAAAWARANATLCRRAGTELVLNASSYYVLSYGLAVIAGAAELGYLRAAQTLYGPATVVLLGGAILGVPESVRARGRPAELARFAKRLSGGLTLLSVACGVAVLGLLPVVGPHWFPASWRPVRNAMPTLTLFGAALGVGAGPTAALRALDDSKWILRARGVTSLLALVLGLPAGALWGAAGTFGALGTAECLLAARSWVRFLRLRGADPAGGGEGGLAGDARR